MATTDSTWLKTYCSDVVKGCTRVPDSSVDVAIFSPPYFNRDGYTYELMFTLGKVLQRTLKPGSRAYMVFGQLKDQFSRPWEASDAIAKGGGLDQIQTIIWVKSAAMGGWMEECPVPGCKTKFKVELLQRGHYTPITPKANVLNYGFEYIFGFEKPGPEKVLDRESIGVAFTDKTNLTRGTRGKNGDLHCAGDVWFIPYSTIQDSGDKRHRHQFPIELPRRLIEMNNIKKGGVVFDPFLGGGTTALAARICGMNCYGYDVDKDGLKVARGRWKAKAGERWRLKGARV